MRDLTRRGLQPDRVFWNTIIRFYAAQVSGWVGKGEGQYHRKTDMHIPTCPYESSHPISTPIPQKINNNQQGDVARAREALQEMRRGHNIEPDAISYTTCIQACGRVRFVNAEGLI